MNSILVSDQSLYQATTSYLSAKIQKQHQLLLTDTNYQYSCVTSHLPDRFPLRPKYRDRIEGRWDLVICNQGRWVQRVKVTSHKLKLHVSQTFCRSVCERDVVGVSVFPTDCQANQHNVTVINTNTIVCGCCCGRWRRSLRS